MNGLETGNERENLDGVIEFRLLEEGGDSRQGVGPVFVLGGDGLVDVPDFAGLKNTPMVFPGSSEPGGGEYRATVRFRDSPEDFYDSVKSR